MLLQPYCLLPELHKGITELFNFLKDHYSFSAEFPNLKEHLLNLVRIEPSHEHTEMPSVCNISVLKPLQR